MADLHEVRQIAAALIAQHLDERWTFDFDNAKKRAGLTTYGKHRISVSRYLAATWSDDEIRQILLHEVAHALAGHAAGHGPKWKAIATDLGYTGGRLHTGSIATEKAPWFGVCSGGHKHYRFRKPTRLVSCAKCSRRFSLAHRITWMKIR